MKLLVVAGPPSAGKTALVKQIIRHFGDRIKTAFLKIDVVKAYECFNAHHFKKFKKFMNSQSDKDAYLQSIELETKVKVRAGT